MERKVDDLDGNFSSHQNVSEKSKLVVNCLVLSSGTSVCPVVLNDALIHLKYLASLFLMRKSRVCNSTRLGAEKERSSGIMSLPSSVRCNNREVLGDDSEVRGR